MFASIEAKLIGLGATVLLISCLVGAIFFYRGNSIKAEAEKAGAVASLKISTDANATLAKANDNAVQMQKQNSDLMAQFTVAVSAIEARASTQNIAIQRAAANDPQLRDYLSTPVPSSVQRVLTPAPSNVKQAAGS